MEWTNKAIKEEELKKLVSGSITEELSMIHEAAMSDETLELIKKETKCDCDIKESSLIAIHADRIVYLIPFGRIVEAFYKKSVDGRIVISNVSIREDIKSYSISEARAELASKIVSNLIKEKKICDEDTRLVKKLVEFVAREDITVDDVVSSVIVATEATETWKKFYDEKIKSIRKIMRGDIGKIDESKLKPKYMKLYDGSSNDNEVKKHVEVMRADFEHMMDRIGALKNMIESSVDIILSSVYDEDQEMFGIEESLGYDALKGFAESLYKDIVMIETNMKSVINTVNCATCMAKLYDKMTEVLYPREVAINFVHKISEIILKDK